jgi:hypothetical protein
MPSVSSDDGGLEADRDADFFEESEKESEKVGEVRNAVCSVPKVASGANLASVRDLLLITDLISFRTI